MDTLPSKKNHSLDGPILLTFLKYLLPSLIGMVAISSASIVDGFFIGNWVGVDALAAVNLIIPVLSFIFGLGLMLSMGGAVRGGLYLGERNQDAASAIFSKIFFIIAIYGIIIVIFCLLFEQWVFRAVGASDSLFSLMSDYYRIILPFFIAQLLTVVLYFFIRLDGYPNLAAAAIFSGSVANIGLDYLFIIHFDWALQGAALATGISQLVPLIILLTYFLKSSRSLHLSWVQKNWSEVFLAAYNGVSEFINEISAALIMFIFNWALITRIGIEGVAALTVVNYLMMIGFMIFFSIGDTSQVMISLNFGARRDDRIRRFLSVAQSCVIVVSTICIGLLLLWSEPLIRLFLNDDANAATIVLAQRFISYIWPAFILVGSNMLITSYLTAVHRPTESGLIALLRSLLLPASTLIILFHIFNDYRFVMATPIAEAFTFIIAGALFYKYRPSRLFSGASMMD